MAKTSDKETKGKGKDEDALVGRVKKMVKKSRRKLSEEKFEKQLQRTISFLEELRSKLGESELSSNGSEKPVKKKKTKIEKEIQKKTTVDDAVKVKKAKGAKVTIKADVVAAPESDDQVSG